MREPATNASQSETNLCLFVFLESNSFYFLHSVDSILHISRLQGRYVSFLSSLGAHTLSKELQNIKFILNKNCHI